jgi:hypothetical protein
MVCRGTIKLFNKHGLMLEYEIYRFRSTRRDIFNGWEKKYPEDFIEMYMDICPRSFIGNVKKDGLNFGALKT